MRKTLYSVLGVALCPALLLAKSPSKPADFSGRWVLDASRTKTLPQGLDRCTMSVNQNEQQLKVETTVEGELHPAEDTGRTSGRTQTPGGYPGSPGGYPRTGGIGIGGIGIPGTGNSPMGGGIPGVGMPGGGRGTSHDMSRAQADIAALTLYPRSAVYKLDGGESTAHLGGPAETDATLRADWEKSGKALKLSLVSSGERRAHEVQLKHEWKLSNDGQSLMVDRSLRSPEGSGTLHLVFHKQPDDSNGGSASGSSDSKN